MSKFDLPGCGFKATAAHLADLVDADVLQWTGVLGGHDVGRDVFHQPVEVLRRGAVEPLLVHRSDLGGSDVRRSGRVRDGVMLVCDHPPVVHLSQPDGEP